MNSSMTGITFDTRLTGVAVSFLDKNSAWQDIIPIIPSASTLTKFPVFDPNMDAFRVLPKEGIKNVGRSKPAVVSSGREMKEVTIQPYHAMSDLIPQIDIIEDAAIGIDTVEQEALFVLQTINNFMDVDLFNFMLNTTLWGAAHTLTNKWDSASGDPEDDILALCDTIQVSNGGKRRPNTLVLGQTAFRKMLSRNNKMRDDLKYVVASRPEMISVIKGLFGLDKIVVVPTAKNTAKKGQTASMSAVWESKAWLGYLENGSPSPQNLSAMYGISLRVGGANNKGIAVSKILPGSGGAFEDGTIGEKVLVNVYTNFFQTSKQLGCIIDNIY